MHLVARIDASGLTNLRTRVAGIADHGPALMARALNEAGGAIRQATVAAETAQTGLKQGTIDRAQKTDGAYAERLTFSIRSKGGNVRLKYFGAKEGGGGVTASPWRKKRFYRGAFITSGPRGRRAPSPKLNGHVFRNVEGGAWGGKIETVRSGLFIPTEMTKGATLRAFRKGASGVGVAVLTRIAAGL